MPKEEMIVQIDKDCNTTVEFNNFAGKSCELEDAKIRLILGTLGVKAEITHSDIKTVRDENLEVNPEQIKNIE